MGFMNLVSTMVATTLVLFGQIKSRYQGVFQPGKQTVPFGITLKHQSLRQKLSLKKC